MRVGLLGGECTGKTTLAEALAAAIGGRVVSEVLREFVGREDRAPRADEQAAILDEQRAREDLASGEGRIVICDPATLMTAVYSDIYFADRSLDALAIAQAHDYDVLLWCRPDIPWIAEDVQHDGPDMRQRADVRIGDLVAAHGLAPVHIRGSVDARTALALAAIRGAGAGPAWQTGAGVGGT